MAGTRRFLAGLRAGPVPVCDACIALAVGWSRRQSTNAAGRALAAKGVLHREKGPCARCGRVKMVSRLAVDEGVGANRPWHWRDHVLALVADFLAAQGYRVHPAADASPKQRDADIAATRDGETLWVTVKGYPEGSSKNAATAQARRWFSTAMLDVVRYRTERPDVTIGVGLPDGFPAYLELAAEVAWLKNTVPFRFFWVAENGNVREE